MLVKTFKRYLVYKSWSDILALNGSIKNPIPPLLLLNFFIWVNANGLGSSIVEKKRTLWACRQVSDVHLWCFWFLFKYNWTENATVLGTAKQTKNRGLRLAIHEGVQSYWDLLGHMLWELEISTQKCKLKCLKGTKPWANKAFILLGDNHLTWFHTSPPLL